MFGQALEFGRIQSSVSEFWGFKFRGVHITTNFQRLLVVKLCIGGEYVFEVRERTSSITMLRLMGLGYHAPPGGKKVPCFLSLLVVCFFVCLSVTLLKDKVCERHFAIKALAHRNDLGIVGMRNVCSSTLSLHRWSEPPQNDNVEKMAKLGLFRISRATQ